METNRIDYDYVNGDRVIVRGSGPEYKVYPTTQGACGIVHVPPVGSTLDLCGLTVRLVKVLPGIEILKVVIVENVPTR